MVGDVEWSKEMIGGDYRKFRKARLPVWVLEGPRRSTKLAEIGNITTKTVYKKKQIDDVLGGSAAWENVDSTEATCQRCEHDRAYFMQIQIRSADEPMSLFYKCCKCGYQWREG
ncbi:DNA-directed RNA polymerase III subunit RPC10 [Rhizophlyctis rosea]|uniref:DNA-directed RNA polymerase III subunit RPC10 n=1 Tax=Rhizophlyctis rosea TaxID=64517 RepID=A0AAD5SA30_9FUNG|nr:DNA-directed RNA polymerase III subunit RPC10 [Rhizophlyctis rosea]